MSVNINRYSIQYRQIDLANFVFISTSQSSSFIFANSVCSASFDRRQYFVYIQHGITDLFEGNLEYSLGKSET